MTITLQQLYQAAEDGLSQSEAAVRLGVTRQRISQLVQEYRDRGAILDFPKGTLGVKPILIEESVLQDLIERGKTIPEMVKELGVSYRTVKARLDENDLSPHRRIRYTRRKRPSAQNTKSTSITVPGDLLDWAQEQAKREGRSVSWFVSDALEAYQEGRQGESKDGE